MNKLNKEETSINTAIIEFIKSQNNNYVIVQLQPHLVWNDSISIYFSDIIHNGKTLRISIFNDKVTITDITHKATGQPSIFTYNLNDQNSLNQINNDLKTYFNQI